MFSWSFTFIPILGLLVLILVIWAIFDIVKHEEFSDIEKLIWVLVVVFLNIIGVIVYYLAGRPKAIDLEKIRSEVALQKHNIVPIVERDCRKELIIITAPIAERN